ncbi:hypothetical protein DESC_850014 [Desulfosarcina cetonica]|nr:hypothetical protein DESC_850014 [Desulfosarcina cetonica]
MQSGENSLCGGIHGQPLGRCLRHIQNRRGVTPNAAAVAGYAKSSGSVALAVDLDLLTDNGVIGQPQPVNDHPLVDLQIIDRDRLAPLTEQFGLKGFLQVFVTIGGDPDGLLGHDKGRRKTGFDLHDGGVETYRLDLIGIDGHGEQRGDGTRVPGAAVDGRQRHHQHYRENEQGPGAGDPCFLGFHLVFLRF